jgi:outer membrane lipoprotein carrier protein
LFEQYMKNWQCDFSSFRDSKGRGPLAAGGFSPHLVCLLLALLLAWAGPARADDPAQLAGRIQKKYASINAFSASFTQAIRNAASGDTENRSGSFVFKKPLLVRWETVKPEKELLLVGASAVWDYFEEDKEAFRYSVQEIIGSKTMLRFLTGKANLTEDFLVAAGKAETAGPGQAVLDLAPKEPEPGLVMAKVWVDTTTDLIVRVHIQDFYANTNDLTLTNLVLNPKLGDELFAFTPPKDVKVHDNMPAKGRDLKQ